MIQTLNPLAQATLGTLFTWGLTAAGAAVVVFVHGTQRKLLDASLGFAAGVMIAASYWSLLAPAIELAEESPTYGANGEYAFVPVGIGFFFGGLFVYLTDVLISSFGLCAPHLLLAMENDAHKRKQFEKPEDDVFIMHRGINIEEPHGRKRTATFERATYGSSTHESSRVQYFSSSEPSSLHYPPQPSFSGAYPGQPRPRYPTDPTVNLDGRESSTSSNTSSDQWKRIVLLIVAITVHNIPEGLAVGVGFGAIGSSPAATFESARNLAIGIGIQNFPEGLAVSLPLRAAGFSIWRSFWYGQLSGMVEPVFGILGVVAVSLAKPLLPYALSFAAGAMIYVVVDDIIPEANASGNGKLASWGTVLGFLVMMSLDVGLGATSQKQGASMLYHCGQSSGPQNSSKQRRPEQLDCLPPRNRQSDVCN